MQQLVHAPVELQHTIQDQTTVTLQRRTECDDQATVRLRRRTGCNDQAAVTLQRRTGCNDQAAVTLQRRTGCNDQAAVTLPGEMASKQVYDLQMLSLLPIKQSVIVTSLDGVFT